MNPGRLKRVVGLSTLVAVGLAVVSCSAGDGQPTSPRAVAPSESAESIRAITSLATNLPALNSVDLAAVQVIASELRNNRAHWVGNATMKSDPSRYCSGLVSLVAANLPSHGGVSVGRDWKMSLAKRLVYSNPRCAPVRSMSIFGAVGSTHLGESVTTVASADTLSDGQDADAWADATFTESWADDVSSTTTGGMDLDATVQSIGMSLGGGKFDDELPTMIFLSYAECNLVCSMKIAFVSGCVATGQAMVPYARSAGILTARIFGPAAGVAMAVGVVASGCVTGGTIAALIVYDIWPSPT